MEPAPEAMAQAALSDHLLEEIFVRIGDPADLARASAACKDFRRLITDHIFLRRYRSIHPPLLLGFVHYNPPSPIGFAPAEAPHPNAPAARSLAGAADFSLDHVPTSHTWSPCDARDGRVLLMYSDLFNHDLESPELAMCDPLTREYTLLPPIPDDLLDSVRGQMPVSSEYSIMMAFFDPLGCNDEAQFRVMCWTRSSSTWGATISVKFVYSSVSGSWTHGTSILQVGNSPLAAPRHNSVYGCLYYAGINKMIKLDIKSMESATVSLPADYEKSGY